MSLGTKLHTWLKGDFVGKDEAGNKYYTERGNPKKRWVLYAGAPEASKVPPEWHRWLHHTVAETPIQAPPEVQPWEKAHQPNMTGSALAYRPPGHSEVAAPRAKATGDYEAWTPE